MSNFHDGWPTRTIKELAELIRDNHMGDPAALQRWAEEILFLIEEDADE